MSHLNYPIAQENKVNWVKQRNHQTSQWEQGEIFTLLPSHFFPAKKSKGMKASTLLQVASVGISRRLENAKRPRLSNLKIKQGYARSTPRKGPFNKKLIFQVRLLISLSQDHLIKLFVGQQITRSKQWYCEKLTWLFITQQTPAGLAKNMIP